jgi:hypothetical protein
MSRLEADVREIRDQISQLHNNSMAFVNEVLLNLERRLTDKLEAQTQEINQRIAAGSQRLSGDRLTIGLAVLSSLVAVIISLVKH